MGYGSTPPPRENVINRLGSRSKQRAEDDKTREYREAVHAEQGVKVIEARRQRDSV
jgi:hypothetical protein